ncbi:phage integrase SAM-like domain-containing protein [Marinilactibacillus psychrotolerans]|uniref:phage integrase SAM-like domain-containing protein n=1 Tax=Marinilactibacillus psychrotolerans TaxID=191770 RepID=UPI0037FAF8DB
MKDITVQHVQDFRAYLLTPKEKNGRGYSQATASFIFGMFRKTLDQAVELDC